MCFFLNSKWRARLHWPVWLSWFCCLCMTLPMNAAFVSAQNQSFEQTGLRMSCVGVNYWQAVMLAFDGAPGDRPRLCRELDELAALGLRHVRLLALSERSTSTTLDPVATEAPGVYNEAWFKALDFVLVELSKRGMSATLCLNNYWHWSGGMSQYVAWSTSEPSPPESAGWDAFNTFATRFYSEEGARKIWRDAVVHLMTRCNSVSGVSYLEDPSIFSWQLANEARPGTHAQTEQIGPLLLAWSREELAFLASLKPRQMLSHGCEGVFGCNGDAALFEALCRIPELSYITVHLWPQNWSWFDPLNPVDSFESTMAKVDAFLLEHEKIAQRVGKPWVLEEFGLPRDQGSFSPKSTTLYRDRFVRSVCEALRRSEQEGGFLSGLSIWSWAGEGLPLNDKGEFWYPGRPLTGDNPTEPQGWYSVFSADGTTKRLLSEAASPGKAPAGAP